MNYQKAFYELVDKLWEIIRIIEKYNGRCPLQVKREIEEYIDSIDPRKEEQS